MPSKRQYGGNFNYIYTSVPEAKGKHQSWNQYETKHFYQVPVAPAIVKQIPLLIMNEKQRLEKIIDKHGDGRAFCQAKNDVIKRMMAFRGNEVFKNSMAYGSLEDNHGQTRINAGNKKQDRNKLRPPQWMNFGLGHQKQSPEA